MASPLFFTAQYIIIIFFFFFFLLFNFKQTTFYCCCVKPLFNNFYKQTNNILTYTGDPNMEDENFLEFVRENRVPDNEMPKAARVITEDRAVHLALTYNNWMYRSTKQKRAQLENAIYWGYVSALRQTLHQCMVKESFEGFRFCRPLYRAYLDAMSPITNITYLWEEEDIENLKQKRLQIFERWNRKKQEMWDKHGLDSIEEEHDRQY